MMDIKIPFNKPPFIGKELDNINRAIQNNKLSGDGEFTKKCHQWFNETFNCKKSLLTTSCTHALDMTALMIIEPGDEVIMPSYTFVSTANAFVLRGAKIVFVDIRPDTMNINENLIEQAITNKTKAIVPVHYAGVSCEMDKIIEIARKHNLYVIEDAAQGVKAKYYDKYLGTIGDFGCYSFHETKNYSCGEGGAILINRGGNFSEKAEIIREKGTNRSKFFRGQVDKYSWVDIGSSYLLSELNAAFLYAQLKEAERINTVRLNLWNLYYHGLNSLEERGDLKLPTIPHHCKHNAHMFYIKTDTFATRTKLIEYLKSKNILSVFHYIPLHSSIAGEKYGYFNGKDIHTTKESEKLLRLPLYYSLKKEEVCLVIDTVRKFFI